MYRSTNAGMCSESRDLYKCWEISVNISLTVQGRDTVAVEIVCGLSNGTSANKLIN